MIVSNLKEVSLKRKTSVKEEERKCNNVTIVDEIMGSGKTFDAIEIMKFFNATGQKYIYVSLYRSEIYRVMKDVGNGSLTTPPIINQYKTTHSYIDVEIGSDNNASIELENVNEYNKNEKIVPLIEQLITIILQYFITKDTYDCLHRLTPDWKAKENEIWAGHNAECSWILCQAAKSVKNQELLVACNTLSLNIMEQVIKKALDTENGGVYNVLKNNLPTEDFKIWWPQAEVVLALLNCYNISKDIKYKTQAIELIDYISNNFIAENGEWFTEIFDNGKPNTSIPIIHFWKSMYHTVRYYAEIKESY